MTQKTLIRKLLIANRGEIACRIIRSCRKLGIATLAVYSEADQSARHVRLADEAVLIGPAAPTESYLKIDTIIQVAKDHGADAIHPGYGFLSENVDFVRACEQAGLIFVGPSVSTIKQMGSKAEAKSVMEAANVPTVPGYHGAEQDESYLSEQAERIGFPLMVKAAAGGGGKGMRIVRNSSDFSTELASAKREAINAFGDDRVILERYIELPRHIEVQIFGDQNGQIVHLFERDCSSQRRYQKVIEECPAVSLSSNQRSAMLSAAVDAAKAVQYVNAGTVEFIVDAQNRFYFMEMNTRLQVEHPVTEMVTGLDLVEWQLKIASGFPLPKAQNQIESQGHAFEARIYAEDPDSGFLPSSGVIHWLQLPRSARIDASVDEGDEVTVFYDPMIAKLIVHASDRQQALAELRRALSEFALQGPKTNLDFLLALSSSPELTEGKMHTALLDQAFEQIMPPLDAPPPEALLAAAVSCLLKREDDQHHTDHSPWGIADGWRLGKHEFLLFQLNYKGQHYPIQSRGYGGCYQIQIMDVSYDISDARIGPYTVSFKQNGKALHYPALSRDSQYRIVCDQRLFELSEEDPFDFDSDSAEDDHRLIAPMPGKIVAIKAKQGDPVKVGEELIIMEAMKMELSLTASMSGRLLAMHCAADEFVEADTLLAEIEPDND